MKLFPLPRSAFDGDCAVVLFYDLFDDGENPILCRVSWW